MLKKTIICCKETEDLNTVCVALTMTLQLLPGAAKMMNAMQGNNKELKNIRGLHVLHRL